MPYRYCYIFSLWTLKLCLFCLLCTDQGCFQQMTVLLCCALVYRYKMAKTSYEVLIDLIKVYWGLWPGQKEYKSHNNILFNNSYIFIKQNYIVPMTLFLTN